MGSRDGSFNMAFALPSHYEAAAALVGMVDAAAAWKEETP